VYKIELLTEQHEIDHFDSGVESKDQFLRKFALQNSKGGLGRTYVAIRPESRKVDGYYTISSSSVKFENLPNRNLPRYPIPSILLGKLAIDRSAQGQGLGTALLYDALQRAAQISEEIGVFLVEVKALDENAKRFYLKYEFVEMLDSPMSLFLNLKKIRHLLKNG
jgi:GNAT superfamily N-acetyltransferase